MGFSFDLNVPAVTVFFQGLLSFFSPCVLPLLPLYIGYLSGGTGSVGEDGRVHYKRGRVLIHTVFFVAGISFAFFLLGFGVSALGSFFKERQQVFAGLGGVVVILFGLYQLGAFGSSQALSRERRLPFRLDQMAMSPVTALVMGFTFSFAWTPCVGPVLTSVLLMAASAQSKGMGFVLIGVYTAGFVLPFLAVGLFTTTLLEFFKNHRNVVKYTVKIGGALMVFMGVLMVTGKMNEVTGYLSGTAGQQGSGKEASLKSTEEMKEEPESEGEEPEKDAAAGVPETENLTERQTGTEKESESGQTPEPDAAESGGETESAKEDKDSETNSAQDNAEGEEKSETERMSESGAEEKASEESDQGIPVIPAPDFTLEDQFGETHTLSDYKGKTVFLNFWATWCPPCRSEMPDIQELYETYDQEGEEALIVLGVAAPGWGQETSQQGIVDFLEENGYDYPVLMDTTGEQFSTYGISALPTTYMIDREGNIFGYVSGMMSMEMMESAIEQTMTGNRK